MFFRSALYPHPLAPDSSKAALYLSSSYIASPSSIARYYADPILANTEGHGLLADMLISYIQSQVCIAWSAARGSRSALPVFYTLGSQSGMSPKDVTGLFGSKGRRKGGPAIPDDPDAGRPRPPPGHAVGLQVPMSRIASRPADLHSLDYEEIAPMCVSANDLVNLLPPSLFHGSGWHAFHPPPTGVPATDSISHCWFSTLPTSQLCVPNPGMDSDHTSTVGPMYRDGDAIKTIRYGKIDDVRRALGLLLYPLCSRIRISCIMLCIQPGDHGSTYSRCGFLAYLPFSCLTRVHKNK